MDEVHDLGLTDSRAAAGAGRRHARAAAPLLALGALAELRAMPDPAAGAGRGGRW